MNNYTIFCTPEQTQLAHKLGAPIEHLPASPDLLVYPTAEEMIGWLEEQGKFKVIAIHNSRNLDWSFHITPKDKDVFASVGYNSRKAATIAAIDAALEYLTNKK